MTKTIQNGGFTNPAGGLLTGNLLLVLSQDAKVAAAPNQVAPIATRIPISAGNIAPTLIYFNDELLPGNTYYTATAYDAAGNKTYGPEIVSLTGAGPLDLGTLVPLLISPDPLFSNPVLQNPSLPQTINGTLTITGPATATIGNLNNIRIIDGVKYAKSAAGINQADADLTALGGPGEIWVTPGTTTATDAQISIGDLHNLRVSGNLVIDASAKGPILMGKYSSIYCTGPAGSTASNSTIVHANTSSIPSMIRFRVQDGSLEMFNVENCQISAGNAPVTRGIIDVSGMNDRGRIQNNVIAFYASGWGIYGDSVLGVFGQFNITNNWIVANNAPSTGSCIYLHGNSATNLGPYDVTLRDNECQLQNNSGTNPSFLVDNTSGNPVLVRDIFVDGMYFSSTPAGQYDISIGSNVTHPSFHHIVCAGNGSTAPFSNCINIASGILVDMQSIWNFSTDSATNFTNTINDTTFTPTFTVTNQTNAHVPMYTSGAGISYVSPNLVVIPTANFGGIQIGRLGGAASSPVSAPALQLLTNTNNAAARSWDMVINNINNGDLNWRASTSNLNAPSTVHMALTPTSIATSLRAFAVAADLGAACTNGELALSANWAATGSATVTAVAGNGQTCSWTITTGTTTGANPTITDTLTSSFVVAPVCEMNIHGGTHTAVAGEGFQQTTLSATAPVFTFNGTPTAGGTTYFVTRRCGP